MIASCQVGDNEWQCAVSVNMLHTVPHKSYDCIASINHMQVHVQEMLISEVWYALCSPDWFQPCMNCPLAYGLFSWAINVAQGSNRLGSFSRLGLLQLKLLEYSWKGGVYIQVVVVWHHGDDIMQSKKLDVRINAITKYV